MTKLIFDISIYCTRMLQGTAAVFLNLLTIICMVKYENLWNPAGVLVTSLAVSDLLHGLLMYTLPLRTYGSTPCIISYTGAVFTIQVQLINFCLVALERRNSLLAQFDSSRKWKIKKVGNIVIIVWVLLAALNVVFVLLFTLTDTRGQCAQNTAEKEKNDPLTLVYAGISIVFFSVALIIVAMTYSSIARIVIRSQNQVNSNQPITVQQRERRKADLRITKMMALVVGVFFTLYIPSVISLIFMAPTAPFWQYALHHITLNILDVNFWINPLIYVWRNKQFKRAFSSLFSGCKLSCRTETNPTANVDTISQHVNSLAAAPVQMVLLPRHDVVSLPSYLQEDVHVMENSATESMAFIRVIEVQAAQTPSAISSSPLAFGAQLPGTCISETLHCANGQPGKQTFPISD